jgi:Rps23 Pro-64 3,4-dihydroxylase Tpa1-like proline 4-hydroxylase
MRRALTCTPDLASDSFSSVLARLSHLGNDLGNALGRRHASGIESAYVAYPPGGYYRRHRDSVVGVDVRGSGRRSTSFILYLTDPDLPWSRADGGALRIFSSTAKAEAAAPAPAAARASEDEWDEDEEEKDEKDVSAAVPGGVAEDVLPESGLLVIFDSKSLWHEVLPTSRHRLCLVGWFLHEA